MRKGLASAPSSWKPLNFQEKHIHFGSSRQFGTKSALFVGGDAKAASARLAQDADLIS